MYRLTAFKCLLICAMTALALTQVIAVDLMETESEIGTLLLIRSEYDDLWSALDMKNRKFYDANPNRNEEKSCLYEQRVLACYRNYYSRQCESHLSSPNNAEPDILPTKLIVHDFDRKVFPNGIFAIKIFKNLKSIIISNLSIATLDENSFVGADKLEALDLSHNLLEKLPSKCFANTRELYIIDLSHNRIEAMPSDVFANKIEQAWLPTNQLRDVRLNHNLLTFIDEVWFRHLPNLETVYLNDNLLTEFDASSSFSFNRKLSVLHLENNRLLNISTDGSLTSLTAFDISNNPQNIGTRLINVNARQINMSYTNSSECFIPPNAKQVHAEHNRIRSVVISTVFSESSVEVLFLDFNKLESIDFIVNLTDLRTLGLSHNELTHLDSKLSDKLLKLTKLDVSHNKIASIDFVFFESAIKLEYFNVSNNFLTGQFELNAKANALIELNIGHNNYTSVQYSGLRKQAPLLQRIILNGNYFECNDLTLTVLFLNFDHITAVPPNELSSIYEDNVRGIKCHESKKDDAAQKVKQIDTESVKNDMSQSFDAKLSKSESRLIALFNTFNTTATTTIGPA